jgi:GntR family transcriptional regulator
LVPKKAANAVVSGPRDLPIPLYEHVKRLIAEAILVGEMAPGMVLPGEVTLATRYGVAVGTIRRALADLTADGMLTRRRKTGTMVTGRTPQHNLRFFFQFFRLHGKDGALLKSEAEVISVVRRPAEAGEATHFGVEIDEPLISLHRVRRIDGKPVMHSHISLVSKRMPGFPEQPARVPKLLYRHLLDAYGIRISAVRESLTAAIATEEDRRLLSLCDPEAVMVIDEKAYDQSGAATILSSHRATTTHHCYVNEIR